MKRRRGVAARRTPINQELGTDKQLEPVLLRSSHVRSDDAGHAALVDDGQGRVSELLCARHEFLRLARSSKEGEVADAAQFCVIGDGGHHCVLQANVP